MEAKVLQNYEICYPDPLILDKGDVVEVLKEETRPEWKGYFYCRDSEGKEGWISESFLEIRDHFASLIKPYNATELNAAENEVVEVLFEDNGWCWCRNSAKLEGWLPKEILDAQT